MGVISFGHGRQLRPPAKVRAKPFENEMEARLEK
jgi:hypothetical protein